MLLLIMMVGWRERIGERVKPFHVGFRSHRAVCHNGNWVNTAARQLCFITHPHDWGKLLHLSWSGFHPSSSVWLLIGGNDAMLLKGTWPSKHSISSRHCFYSYKHISCLPYLWSSTPPWKQVLHYVVQGPWGWGQNIYPTAIHGAASGCLHVSRALATRWEREQRESLPSWSQQPQWRSQVNDKFGITNGRSEGNQQVAWYRIT